MSAKQVDVRHVQQFMQGATRIVRPVEILRAGKVIGRIVPPGELSEAEKEVMVREGWQVIQEARARNKGRTSREIGNIVDAAVKRVRARK